ncbi:MAG: RagB/SusD family nutrient uptake outer membrane protein [Tenacibaculum sp.]|nr:RagB/SusD family nutrient uptake outer membrane protein [Tenacibaculum sp.]
MKKYIYALAITGTALFSSCNDELNKIPYDSMSQEQILSSAEGFDNATRGIYAGFVDNKTDNVNAYYGASMYSVPDILTDNVILDQTGRQTKKTFWNWQYTANSTLNLYGDAYKIVRKANAIINNIGNLPSGDFKNSVLGEALTARALAHFDLARFYAKIPTQSTDANSSLGVAYVTEVNPGMKPSRNTVGEVYTKIIADLVKAETIIGEDNGKGRFNKNAVNALLSRVYLYMGEWQKSVDAAEKVTGTVAKRNNFKSIWTDDSTDGIISEFIVTPDDRAQIGNQYSQSTSKEDIKSEYVISYEFYQLFKDNDIRKSAYIYTSKFSGSDYNHIVKYYGKNGQTNGRVNAKILRMAEVMLNKAEAYAELGNDAKALEAVDAVRKERYENFSSNNESGEELKKVIALERRLEFAFEAQRFFDLKRKGLSIKRGNKGDKADGTGEPAVFKELKANDHKFQLPIPLDAINSNGNIKQNPGY